MYVFVVIGALVQHWLEGQEKTVHFYAEGKLGRFAFCGSWGTPRNGWLYGKLES